MNSITINIVYSKRDRSGNCYWAFTAFNHDTQKAVSGKISGNDSNIRAAEFMLRDRWPNTGEPCWCVNVGEMPIRKWNSLTAGWPYAGCTPAEILEFIRKTEAAAEPQPA